uniref:HTH_OrfB_IS605 domain-containing protein n=1 Tax=Ascaris lumbricoides TaxID=6252 RepID=A0A0M3I672_ASCLU
MAKSYAKEEYRKEEVRLLRFENGFTIPNQTKLITRAHFIIYQTIDHIPPSSFA